jgi:hypothetical protein
LLFYAAGCPKCRVLSRLIVIASAGLLRRAPVNGGEAEAWYERHPERRGKLMLVHGDESVVLGRWVYPAMPMVLARAWLTMAGWAAAGVARWLLPQHPDQRASTGGRR